MKYKVLLCGRSKVIIDDFFAYMTGSFEVQSMSMRKADVLSHLQYFRPNAVLFCMHKEEQETIDEWSGMQDVLTQYKIPLLIAGSEEECKKFQLSTGNMAEMALTKPILVRSIGEKIKQCVDEWLLVHPEEIQEPEEEDRKKVQKAEETAKTEFEQQKKHILVVDDDPLMLRLVKEQLKGNYHVATAVSGALALRFLEYQRTDLMLLDYEMPGADGAKILQQIRDNDATSNLPVVFLTGITEKEKIEAALLHKPQGYLLKPIDGEKLNSIIKNILG